MEYTELGNSGLSVSRIGLGCMGFGPGREWGLDEAESRDLIDHAVDLGINFFDTANVYGHGASERILGRALSDHDPGWAVVATKVYGDMDPENPNASGLSRKSIEQELTESLDRLDMDNIDLYQIHRWDNDTTIEETLRTLTDAVRNGQVRYLGASSMWAYQLASALETSRQRNLERFVSMQNHYNLAYREEEREVLPLCRREGIGVIPWSPLAQGFLARPAGEIGQTRRGPSVLERHPEYSQGGGPEINARVRELATEYGASMAQIALAWLFYRGIDAPIIGTTSQSHLDEAVEALDIQLSRGDVTYLEDPYEPLPISGHD